MEDKKKTDVVQLKTPVTFEGKQYDKIDLTCMENINAADMIAVGRHLSREGISNVNQEFTLEYALNLAARASNMPIEFYEQLGPRPTMQVKSCVSSFLFGQE